MTEDERTATLLLVGHFIDGRDATAREVSTALAILAKNRPWSEVGRFMYAAMAASNLARMPRVLNQQRQTKE